MKRGLGDSVWTRRGVNRLSQRAYIALISFFTLYGLAVSGALDRLERQGSASELAEVLTQLEQAAIDLDADSRVSVAGERPTERNRMRSLAATLRGLAGSMR